MQRGVIVAPRLLGSNGPLLVKLQGLQSPWKVVWWGGLLVWASPQPRKKMAQPGDSFVPWSSGASLGITVCGRSPT